MIGVVRNWSKISTKKSHSPSWPLGPRLGLVLPYALARRPCARKIWGCLFFRLRQMCAIWLELLNRTLSNCLLSEGWDCAMTEGHQCLAILCNDAKRTMKNMKVLLKWKRVFSPENIPTTSGLQVVTLLTHSIKWVTSCQSNEDSTMKPSLDNFILTSTALETVYILWTHWLFNPTN